MNKIISVLFTLFFAHLLFMPIAVAQVTSDEVPANEGICDGLRDDGITEGLYGLCVAFCEATDSADIAAPISEAELEALLSTAPSGKILQIYNTRKADSDPEMPCVRILEPCPCWTEQELSEIDGYMWDSSPSFSEQVNEPNGRRCFDSTDTDPVTPNIFSYEIVRIYPLPLSFTTANTFRNYIEDSWQCNFRRARNGPDGTSSAVLLRKPYLTEEEHQACIASLKNFQANSGFCPIGQP